MFAWKDIEENITPVRFKIANKDESESIIKLYRAIWVEKEKLTGNNTLVFNCQSVIAGMERLYKIKYEFSSCKWRLFKI